MSSLSRHLIIDIQDPEEYYECECGLKFNHIEGASVHLENTIRHSIQKIVNGRIAMRSEQELAA